MSCEVCGPQPDGTVHTFCHPHPPLRIHGCGHPLSAHTDGLKCRTCGVNCAKDHVRETIAMALANDGSIERVEALLTLFDAELGWAVPQEEPQ